MRWVSRAAKKSCCSDLNGFSDAFANRKTGFVRKAGFFLSGNKADNEKQLNKLISGLFAVFCH